ncbi:protein dopey-1 homolog isoform X2 [Hylaeus volcanicus]|uniref:protein dopey-1 homolog isoform X2 n=1 Tax=Hylaeus volcanicus TaxID=313075 RepID=UPI0023B7E18D|nr:protein dopey-1 homolog isoform X2 [Hylaeus volcanicus]
MGSIALEEYELMKDSKYRVYVSAVDKALKSFEYTSEWADLISALGKLNKVLHSHTKFPVIPRRIKISKRLAQCMHPALPSGVHLKALETYDIIFKCMGTNRLSHELFIYSAGLFPLLGHAAMNVRPSLLTVYETHFVPLGERLRPGLSGFLSGVLLGLEDGSDHFDRTNSLLEKVCEGVGPEHFYACLWDCLASNSGIRLPAISFVLVHFNKKLPMEEQKYIMGTNTNIMVTALCAGVQDSSVLVQRSALDLLLVGFPVHNSQLTHEQMVLLVTAALVTILRRDMSLNRRLFAWLLGTEVSTSILKRKTVATVSETMENVPTYFDLYSKEMLVEAIKALLKSVCDESPQDLKPYRILVSLLEKADIGPVILDDILFEVFRTFYNACGQSSKVSKTNEVVKLANLLFSTLEPSYVWIHCGHLFEHACQARARSKREVEDVVVRPVGSGMPNFMEICILTEFLLETVSLDAFIDTPSEHLPGLFYEIISKLMYHIDLLSPMEISRSLRLCAKILSKVQPTVVSTHAEKNELDIKLDVTVNGNTTVALSDNSLTAIPLEKSQSDSKLNKPDTSSGSFSEKSPSPRRRANSGGAAKRSDKKSKKKSSKSTSKLSESMQDNSSNVSVVVSEDTKSLPRNKSMDDIKTRYIEANNISSPSKDQLTTLKQSSKHSGMGSTGSLGRGPSPAFQAQHTMLEKCLRQYENFYVKLISNRVLSKERKVQDMYDNLLIPLPRESVDERMRYLELLLNSRLSMEDSGFFGQDVSVSEDSKRLDILHLYIDSVSQTEWEEAVRIASSLFVELSTFPKYFHSGDGLLVEEEPKENIVLPDWLKVLVVCSCWLGKQPALQLTSIATLLDLIALLKAHNDTETHPKSGEGITAVIMVPLLKQWHITYLMQYTNVFQVLAHSLWHHLGELPAHKYRMRCVELLHELHHALYNSCDAVEDVVGAALTTENIEKRIESFNRFATLWHLGREIETNPRLRGCMKSFDQSLLKILDNLQLPDNSPLKLHAQSWLLHSLMRGDISRIVDPLLIILLDPSTCRMSVLHVSIQHSNTVLTKNDPVEEKSEVQDDTEGAAKIYAISSVDGNVIYHVSDSVDEDKKWRKGKKKKKAINPVKVKRIFAVTTLAAGENCNQYVTERNQFMKELEVPPSISGNRKISVFVNPLSLNCNENSNDSLTEDELLPSTKKTNITTELLKNATRFKKIDFDKGSTASLDESLFESTNSSLKTKDKNGLKKLNGEVGSSLDSITNSFDSSSPEVTNKQTKPKKDPVIMPGSSREIAGTIIKGKYHSTNEFTTNYDVHDVGSFEASVEVPSWTMNDEESELEASTTAEEYFGNSSSQTIVEEILNEVLDQVMQLCDDPETPKNTNESTYQNAKTGRNYGVGVHNLHSHMLLYCGVYDSTRTLYALRTLRNELLTNTRMFLCCAATTGVTNTTKNTTLLNLLARHRKSVFGRNFHGDIANTEFIAAYRSSMYLEVLISVCLYFARSYYPNLGQMRLTHEEISGNRQVQLASAELLTLIFSELIPIVRDSGKGFSCYIVDLLTKCKVQKVALHCLVSSVMNMKNAHKENEEVFTFTEEIILFNDPVTDSDVNKCKYRASDHTEAFQIQLLRLLLALIMLEHQCSNQKGEEICPPTAPAPSTPTKTVPNIMGNSLKYIPGAPIPQQPMFLASILSALQLDHMRHLHQFWTTLVTSSLPFMGSSLTGIVTSVIHQLCCNIEHLASYYINEDTMTKLEDISTVECCLPADYTVTHLEALTFLLHYCLLDTTQQIGFSFNQPLSGTIQTGIPGANPGQIFNNLIHVFMPSPLSPDLTAPKDINGANELLQHARRTALSHLPRIIASLSTLWQAVLVTKDNEQASCVVGSPRIVKHQLLELLSPISFHHGVNFLAAIAVAWHERRHPSSNSKKVLPEACPNQQVMVHLVSAIRVMPIDTLVQTVHQVVKTPPPIHGVKQDFSLEVSVLELLYVYMQSNTSQSLIESWTSLLGLLKDGLSLTAPAQFLLLAILNEYVQKCPPMQEKKDIRDLQDVSAKLVESCSQIAGACLEQTTWLRRNLAVREDAFEVAEGSSEGKEGKTGAVTPGAPPNAAFSVQAQAVLAEILAPLLDVSYGSQEKERVVTLLTNLMYNVTPYLKNHSTKNIASFTACSQLLSSLSGYQYTRKAWRKDVLDLLLDSAFFQMTPACLPYWRTIIDNLMTHDNTTFRDLMNRVSMAQSSSISIFSSKEQEYEQKAQLLKRLAYVILCSEMDQYHKYMPEIQERLADSLRLPQVIPSIQAQVFLCFRVLLLRMSPQHATSLWPVIVSELVQVFLYIEQELNADSEEFSSHIKLLSALDSSWAVNASNGLQAHGHPHWLQLQLAAAKLLDLALLLPAHRLPQFQMYRWAFVGDSAAGCMDNNNLSSDFVPHITRIAKLMDSKYKQDQNSTKATPGELLLTSNNIRSLQDLHYFFTTLSRRSSDSQAPLNITQLETVIEQDFLEKMPAAR